MKRTPRISEAEWEVMKVLWEESPLSASDVIDKLSSKTDWNHRTIRTLLARLVKKGALTYTQSGKAYLFRAHVKREACIMEESRTFAERLFGGDATPLLANLVKHTKLSPDDIKQLRKILKEKEE